MWTSLNFGIYRGPRTNTLCMSRDNCTCIVLGTEGVWFVVSSPQLLRVLLEALSSSPLGLPMLEKAALMKVTPCSRAARASSL